MADNYLEKRYDEVFGKGGRSACPSRPSLDALIRRDAARMGFDPSYKVHIFQLESIAASVRAFSASEGMAFEPVIEDGRAFIRTTGITDPVRYGECLAIMKLKAAELGLGGIVTDDNILTIGK